jgi:hypothetical protein
VGQAVEKPSPPTPTGDCHAGQTFNAPSGIVSKMDEKTTTCKSVFIGEIKADSQFNVVWKTPGPVKANPGAVHRRQLPKPTSRCERRQKK